MVFISLFNLFPLSVIPYSLNFDVVNGTTSIIAISFIGKTCIMLS